MLSSLRVLSSYTQLLHQIRKISYTYIIWSNVVDATTTCLWFVVGLLLYIFTCITLNAIRFWGYNFVRETEASKVSVAFDKISSRFMQQTDLETTLQRQMLLPVLLNLPLSYWSNRFLNLLALSFLSLHCLQRDIAFYSHRFCFSNL